MLPPAIWLLRLPSPEGRAPATTSAPGQVNVPAVALSAVLLFLYVGAEGAFGGWIFTYVLEAGLASERTAAYLTSAYWGTYTVARLLAIPISLRLAPRTMLLWDTVGCLLSMAVVLLWPASPVAIWLGALGLGASMGSIFPTVISLGERHSHITGRVMGWFFLGGSAGAMSIPWLIGQLFEPIGPRATMWVIVVDLAVMMAVFVALVWSLQRTRAAEA
jgi:fucose permease